MIRYIWPKVLLEVEPATGKVQVWYADGATCGTAPGPLDYQFGKDLGCTGEEHMHAHELMHQLVGFAYYRYEWGSPVVRRAATGVQQRAANNARRVRTARSLSGSAGSRRSSGTSARAWVTAMPA